jgi:aryl-alcohol dehydrogenase-like predicted oxidoreductase
MKDVPTPHGAAPKAATALAKRLLGDTGLSATLLGLGALEIGRDWGVGTDRSRPDEAGAAALLNSALDAGINLIDTAAAYHRSEERIGRHIATRRRQYILATKCGEHSTEPNTVYDYSYSAVADSIRRSLQALQSDTIDILQIHFGPDPHKVLDDGGCLRAMTEAREAGLVKFLGASCDGDVLQRCIDSGSFQIVQVGYSLLRQDEGGRISAARDKGIGVLVRSGLAGGWLTARALAASPLTWPPRLAKLLELVENDPRRLAALALHFLAAHPGVGSILYGTRHPAHLKNAIAALAVPVDGELLSRAARAAAGK